MFEIVKSCGNQMLSKHDLKVRLSLSKRVSPLLYKYHKTSRLSLSFQLADLLPLFILFHALMLVAHWECKLPPLNDTGKD